MSCKFYSKMFTAPKLTSFYIAIVFYTLVIFISEFIVKKEENLRVLHCVCTAIHLMIRIS